MSQSLAVAGWIVAMLTAVSLIGVTVRWLWLTGGKATRVLDALLGEPPSPGTPNGRPGALDRIASIEESQRLILDAQRTLDERVSFLEQQMRPNGGSSLRDTVDRIAATTDETAKTQ